MADGDSRGEERCREVGARRRGEYLLEASSVVTVDCLDERGGGEAAGMAAVESLHQLFSDQLLVFFGAASTTAGTTAAIVGEYDGVSRGT